jgi:23S rRNA (guanosine2251-2'-O)-methyltransferase
MKTTRQTEILYGVHPVTEALGAGRRQIIEIHADTGKTSRRLDALLRLAKNRGIPVQNLSHRGLAGLAGTDNHQGIAARVSPFPVSEWPEILSNAAAITHKTWYLLIDSVSDPQNLGALIRTALCVGVSAIIVPKDRSAGPTPTVSKTSAGALEHIRLARVTNLVYAINDLKNTGVWTFGLDAAGSESIYECDFTGNMALVIGGEETGIRPLVKRSCDFLCRIPQFGPVSSLNASVAGAVAMYEAFRQRQENRKS